MPEPINKELYAKAKAAINQNMEHIHQPTVQWL